MGKTKTQSDDAWAKNLHEWSVDLERATGALVRVVLTPTNRTGVFKVRVEACRVVDGKAIGVLAAQSTYWPNEKATGLHATMFQLAVAVDSTLADMMKEGAAAEG